MNSGPGLRNRLKSIFGSPNKGNHSEDISDITRYVLSFLQEAKPMELIFGYEKGVNLSFEDKSELNRLEDAVRELTKGRVKIQYFDNLTREQIHKLQESNPGVKVIAVLNAGTLSDISKDEIERLESKGAVAVDSSIDHVAVMLGEMELQQYERQDAPYAAEKSLLIQRLFDLKGTSIAHADFLRILHTVMPAQNVDPMMCIRKILEHKVILSSSSYFGRTILTMLETEIMT
jgi:hypothetical protein